MLLGRKNKVIDLRKWHASASAHTQREHSKPPQRKLPLRYRRRNARALAWLVILLALAGAIWGLSLLSYAPRFSIDKVLVRGAEQVPAKLVDAYVEAKLYDGTYPLFSRSNIFLYRKTALEKGVADFFPLIRSIKISRESFLGTAIMVTIKERRPFALWCSDKEICYTMDDIGFIFAESSTSPSSMLIFRGGLSTSSASRRIPTGQASTAIGKSFLPEHMPGILGLITLLRQAGYAPAGARAIDNQDFSILFTEGFTLHASFGSDANMLVRNLKLAFSSSPMKGNLSKLDYIDLRFGNRVYYKFKGGTQQASGIE